MSELDGDGTIPEPVQDNAMTAEAEVSPKETEEAPKVPKKQIKVMKISEGEAVFLCHSLPDVPPNGEGGGLYRSRVSVVWVKEGEHGHWVPTPFRSAVKAMDQLLNRGVTTAAQGVELLKQGEDDG